MQLKEFFMETDFFQVLQGARPSDARFENIHLLAEFIHQAQALSNSAAATQLTSNHLLEGVHIITRDGVERFRIAGTVLASIANTTTLEIREVGTEMIAKSKLAIELPVTKLTTAALRLEAAAEAAVKERREASDACVALDEYSRQINAYAIRVLASLNAKLSGRSLWERVVDVFVSKNILSTPFKLPVPPAMLVKKGK